MTGHTSDYLNLPCLSAKDRALVSLRNALQEAVLQIEYLHEKFQPTGSGEAALARGRIALENAAVLVPDAGEPR